MLLLRWVWLVRAVCVVSVRSSPAPDCALVREYFLLSTAVRRKWRSNYEDKFEETTKQQATQAGRADYDEDAVILLLYMVSVIDGAGCSIAPKARRNRALAGSGACFEKRSLCDCKVTNTIKIQ